MNSNIARVAAGIAAIAVAVLLLVVLKDNGGGDSEPASTPTTPVNSSAGATKAPPAGEVTPTIVIEGGEPVGGVKDLSFEKGDRIHFKVESDVSDEIHVHGYDVMEDVAAEGSVTFDFPATIEGVFEVELEERKQPIAELTVNP